MPDVQLVGKGYWEDEYNRQANLIPGVNQKLLAEIGTDLKHRLSKLYSSKLTAPFLKPFGIETRKEALVREAIETLTRLSNEYNQQDVGRRILGRQRIKRPIEELIAESRTTGELGTPVIRENPPKYAPITSLDATGIFNKTSEPSREMFATPYPKEFKVIDLNTFIPTQPVPWGKFNTIFVQGFKEVNGERVGHSAVLIRNLTNPISYTWYDSHGTSWRSRQTFFNVWRLTLNTIVGDAEVNFNDSKHQCYSHLCKSFARIRATYPDLTNEEYNQELIRTARAIATDPNFEVINSPIPYFVRTETGLRQAGLNAPENTVETMLEYTQEPLPALPAVGEFGYAPGDVFAAPLVAQKGRETLLKNPQRAVPFSTARAPTGNGKSKKCKKCGLLKDVVNYGKK